MEDTDMDFLDQLSQEAKKAGDFIVKKANIAKDYTIATWSAAELRNKIDSLYKKIGKAVYMAHTTEEDTAEEINQYIDEIAELKAALQEKEETKQALRNQKTCPACGKGVGKDHSFCPHCGNEVK